MKNNNDDDDDDNNNNNNNNNNNSNNKIVIICKELNFPLQFSVGPSLKLLIIISNQLIKSKNLLKNEKRVNIIKFAVKRTTFS